MHGQTDSMATDKQERRAAIVAQLAAAGWTPIQGRTAIANKTYPTAVGPKEAQVYLAVFGAEDPNYVLQGQYYSEGRNVLAGDSVLIPKAADGEQVRRLTDQFAAAAEATVLDSYAARLYRSSDLDCVLSMEQDGIHRGETRRLRRRRKQCNRLFDCEISFLLRDRLSQPFPRTPAAVPPELSFSQPSPNNRL